jgi:hypothetical protein
MDYVYVDYLQHMATFFSSVEWWRLEPHDGSLLQNPSPHHRNKMLLAKSAAGDLAVAYLPDNETIEIDMRAFMPVMQARWYRPTHGTFQNNDPPRIENRSTVTFVRPEGWEDAVLLLEALSRR